MFKIKQNPYLFLFTFGLIVFAPIGFYIFSIKNDLLTGYLPVRFFISESIHSGSMPWWNPYVNFGIPQHADMSAGFWNPVSWLIASTVGYNIYSINLESLLYILLGGIGMYKTGSLWSWRIEVKLIAAVCYMCCGYFIGNLQHLNWISGAGFLPFCYYYYVRFLQNRSNETLLLSVFSFSLLLTSSHPGIIIGSIYFFTFVTINHLLKDQKGKSLTAICSVQKKVFLFLILLLLCNAALILSYAELLPYITRDIKPDSDIAGTNTTSMQSLVSFLLPFATVKAGSLFQSDIALRNCYIGLIPFIFMITSFSQSIRKKQLHFFLLVALFFLFLSTNTFLQTKIYGWLPLINYVRLPAEFRIFGLFCLLISGSSVLNEYLYLQQQRPVPQKTAIALIIILAALILFSITRIAFTKDSILYHITAITNSQSLIDKLKTAIDNLSIYDTIILQSIFTSIILSLIVKAIIRLNAKLLLLLAVIDVACATIIQLPFTGYGKLPATEIQQLLNNSPKGIPLPTLQPIIKNEHGIPGIDTILGNWSLYAKQPGTTKHAFYPIIFKSEEYIFNHDSITKIAQHPFLYFSGGEKKRSGSIGILHFSPTTIQLRLKAEESGKLVLLYKHYPHWKASVNNQWSAIEIYNNSFMAINIKSPGTYIIKIQYDPILIRIVSVFQLLLWLSLIILLVFVLRKKNTS